MPHYLLDAETAAYEAAKESLLAAHEHQYVLVHGNEIVGFFDGEEAAIDHGYRTLGNVPFLVKRVERSEQSIDIFCIWAP